MSEVSEVLVQRLDRRYTRPVGVVDVQRFESRFARVPGWIVQRSRLVDQVLTRYSRTDSATGETDLVFPVPAQPVMQQPAVVSAIAPSTVDAIAQARAVSASEPSSPATYRISRRAAPFVQLKPSSSSPPSSQLSPDHSSSPSSNPGDGLPSPAVEAASPPIHPATHSELPNPATRSAIADLPTPIAKAIPATASLSEPSNQPLIMAKRISTPAQPDFNPTTQSPSNTSSDQAIVRDARSPSSSPSSPPPTPHSPLPTPPTITQQTPATNFSNHSEELPLQKSTPAIQPAIADQSTPTNPVVSGISSAVPEHSPLVMRKSLDATADGSTPTLPIVKASPFRTSNPPELTRLAASRSPSSSPSPHPPTPRSPLPTPPLVPEIPPSTAPSQPAIAIWRKAIAPSSRHETVIPNGLPLAIQSMPTAAMIARQPIPSSSTESFSAPSSMPASAELPSPARGVNVAQLAEQVSQILHRQFVVERERRGMNLWF